jgi:signal transduction histidine kinase
MDIFVSLFGVILAAFAARYFFKLKVYKRKTALKEENYKREIAGFRERVSALDDMTQTLNYSNKELERINGLKSKFVAGAAHDLKQPLASIYGYAALLKDSSQSEEDKKMLGIIIRCAENMNLLMNDLIEYNVLAVDGIKLHPEEINYSQLVDEICAQYKVIADKKNITLEEVTSLDEVKISVDRIRIVEVLSNLVMNAIKFTHEGGKIEVRYEIEGKRVKTMVIDSGLGIEPENQEKIFERYHQVNKDKPESGARESSWGLGLSISYDIIKLHGGQIGVKSEGLGKGSSFWYTLPL